MAMAMAMSNQIIYQRGVLVEAKNRQEKKPSEIGKKLENVPPSRDAVLRACLSTCAGISIAGLLTREVSHSLHNLGWFSPDCTVLMPYNFQTWHLGATLGLVTLVAILRQFLLKTWPDFSASSQSSNQRVLSSLQLWDYTLVSFSSGVSEELLFRGALLPLLGVDYKGVLVSGIIFGTLHLTGGRNAAFAIWASVVGVLYGAASVWTGDLLVPMAAHSCANLVAAALWKYGNQPRSYTDESNLDK